MNLKRGNEYINAVQEHKELQAKQNENLEWCYLNLIWKKATDE